MELKFPGKTVWGWGSVTDLGKEAKKLGGKALVMTGRKAMKESGILAKVERTLEAAGVERVLFSDVEPEPSPETVDRAVAVGREHHCDMVLGLGGGSVLDAAKAVAALIPQDAPARVFLYERELLDKGLPFIAIPTTSGTSSEATKNGVLSDHEKGLKVSLRSPYMVPDLVILDPELTVRMSQGLTAATGMDALTHACESYVANNANPLTQALSLSALELLAANIEMAWEQGDNRQAREAMLLGSYLAGVALTNSGLGAVHGLAHALGARFHIPHGVCCALLLPTVMEFNLETCRTKYARVAKAMDRGETAEDAIEGVKSIEKSMALPTGFSVFGVKKSDFDQLIADTKYSGSLKYNPRKAGPEELALILERSL